MAFQLRLNLRSSSRLKRFDTAAASSCNGATQQTTINTGASTSATTKPKNWYQRLKQNDPEEFKRFQKFDAMKSSLNRTNMTNEKKKHYNEMTAKRMRKMRKRKAEEKARAIASGDVQPKQKTKKNRSTCTRQQKLQLEANKEKDRLRKKAKWGAKTQLEKDEINRKRREKRHQDKINRELDRMELLALRQQRQDIEAERERQEEERKRVEDERKRLELVTITQEIAQKTKKAADRKSFSRAWKGFPKKNSASFGRTFKSVYKRAMSSPTKRAQLEENGLAPAHREVDAVVMKSIEDQLALIKNSKKKIDVEKKREIVSKMSLLKKYRLQRSASRQLGIAPKTIRNANRPKHIRKRSIPVATVDAVIAHYISSAIQLPDQKYISKKTLLKTGFLQEPISHIYSSFRTKHPDLKIGLKKFYSLRPKHIKTMGSIKYRGCLCEYCTNIDLKLAAINQLAHRQQLPSRFQGVYSIAKVSMCPKEGDFNRRACIERKCKDCGTMKIQDHLQDIVEKQGDKPITWKKWEKKTSQLNGVTVSRQVINKVEGTLQQCINELKVESESITAHLFNAAWQNRQFSQLTKNLPAGWVVLVLDFAENYTCKYQDEIQSAHWYHSNATVHPIVAYHSCPHCGKTMMTSLVMISPDKTHDFNAVNSFMDLAINHLKSHLGADHVTDVVRFSDGCGAQYKSKGPFYDLSCAQENYNTNVRHEFFGSRHGKGPSDGESAVVKRQASLAVLGGKVTINDARDLFKYCLDKVATKTPPPGECQHFQRTFFYVDDIERDRDMGSAPLKTVKGTRLLHSVRGITAGKICIRNLSCFCFACTQGNDNTCDNESHVDAWTDVTIGTPRATATARDENSQATDAQTVQTHSPADMNHQATNLVTTGDDAETSHMSQTAAVHPSSEGAAAHPSSSEGTASVHPVPSEAEAHLSSSKAKAHPSEAEAHPSGAEARPSGAEDEANAMDHQATNLVTTGDDAETSHMSQATAVHPSSEGAAAHPSSSEGTASVHPIHSQAEVHLSSSEAKAHPSEAGAHPSEAEAHPSGAEDETNAMNVTIGDLVAVALNQCNKRGKVTAKAIYMAEVVDLLIDDDHVVVKYMVKRGRNLYIWPKEEEMEFSTEPMASILTKLSPPQHNTREQYLFDYIELANLERNLTASKVPFHYK